MHNGFTMIFITFGLIFGVFGAIVSEQQQQGPVVPDDCGACIPEECQKPVSCAAGIVMDRCVTHDVIIVICV